MQTEIYQQEAAEAPLPDVYDGWEHRAELVTHLGLEGQGHWLRALEKAKQIPFRPLMGQELAFWEDALPTRYISEDVWSQARHARERLRDYALDLIPMPVLDVWSHCVLSGYFESYEIWAAADDPALIGRLGPLTFLIARWGDSLEPIEHVKDRMPLHRRSRVDRLRR